MVDIMIMALIGSFIGGYYGLKYGRNLAIRKIEKAERGVNRNNNTLRMGLLETYQARNKSYTSFKDNEELYHLMRKYF